MAAGAPRAGLLVQDHQVLAARAQRGHAVLATVEPQADGVLVPRDRPIEIGDREVDRTDARGVSQERTRRARRRGGGELAHVPYDSATSCACNCLDAGATSAEARARELPFGPQRRQRSAGEPEGALVEQVARLPARQELRVEAIEALDLEVRGRQ